MKIRLKSDSIQFLCAEMSKEQQEQAKVLEEEAGHKPYDYGEFGRMHCIGSIRNAYGLCDFANVKWRQEISIVEYCALVTGNAEIVPYEIFKFGYSEVGFVKGGVLIDNKLYSKGNLLAFCGLIDSGFGIMVNNGNGIHVRREQIEKLINELMRRESLTEV